MPHLDSNSWSLGHEFSPLTTRPGSRLMSEHASWTKTNHYTRQRRYAKKYDFLNGPTLAPFLFIFGRFQTKTYNDYNKSVWKMSRSSSIRRWHSNPRPLGHKFPPLTTRLGLPPFYFIFCNFFKPKFWLSETISFRVNRIVARGERRKERLSKWWFGSLTRTSFTSASAQKRVE